MTGRLTRDRVVTCRVGNRDLEAIDPLVEAGIRTTRSAAAWLISAGVEANANLFRRVETAVDEIRRLRDEARALARQRPLSEPQPAAAEATPSTSPPTATG